MNWLDKLKKHFRDLPEKKRYLEFITAMLSIPVLLTVVYMNFMSIQEKKNPKDTDTKVTPVITVITSDEETKSKSTPTPEPTLQPSCKADIGDVQITSPEENEKINENPLTISIDQNDPKDLYCAVVWSYRINYSSWSNYDDKDISIYNLSSGDKNLEVRVKSIISGKEKILKRSFIYENTEEVPTPTPTDIIPTVTPKSPTTSVTVTP